MLTVWNYGKGKEGARPAPERMKRINVVIVDHQYPWWYGAAKSVAFNVTNIWLISYQNLDVKSVVENCLTDAVLEMGDQPSDAFVKAMHQSDCVLINGCIPDALERHKLWTVNTGTTLKLVVYTQPTRHHPGKPWKTQANRVKHSEVGGITDGTFTIFITSVQTPFQDMDSIVIDQHIAQDLRWVLKPNEEGRITSPPEERETLGRVNWYQRNVIHEASLLPWSQMNTQVITRYRHNQWVVRRLTLMEKLLSVDVSEQLIKLNPTKEAREVLLASITVPLKVLQTVAEHCLNYFHGKADIKEENSSGIGKRDWIMLTDDRYYGDVPQRGKTRRLNTMPSISEEKGEIDEGVVAQARLRDERTEIPLTKYDKNAVATKSDDAEVRIDLWDKRLLKGVGMEHENRMRWASDVTRKYLLMSWKWRVLRSFGEWVTQQEEAGEVMTTDIMEAGKDCCRRAFGASWWSWDEGSRPFFWRWPKPYQQSILSGVPVWFELPVTNWKRRQREPKNEEVLRLMREKLDVIRKKGYVEKGTINSLMSFFDVPKGHDDIRMVYDGSKSGLNDSLWAPWFPLPTVECLVRSVEPGYYMADNDVGEMFHNFMLHDDLRKFCGLDLTLFFKDSPGVKYEKGRLWERWNRLAMGLRNSPYNAIQGMMVAKDEILGDRTNENNVFRWDAVRLNLPGSKEYDPSKSWIAKIRKDGVVAADVFIYVDDVRTSAPSEEEAWTASQQTSSTLGHLGLQDAARKRREPGQETGAWTGSVVWTSNGEVVVLTTQDKWDKTKDHIRWIAENLNNKEGLDIKTLKSIRGFLVYIARTYNSMVPYLKGLHATIDSWRPGRNMNGWKYSEQRKWMEEPDEWLFDDKFGMATDSPDEPKFVFPVPRLVGDGRCLTELTREVKPPFRKVRMGREGRVVYGFGDASKQGFGASVELSDKSVVWRSGEFSSMVKERSSNYRELLNLVEYIEAIYKEGLLDDCELFMFTDNSTAEAAYFKGTSSSELLFELVLRLRKIEMEGKCMLHMVHVAGTRMISQGTDGLSRGDRNAGIMAGESMLSFIPLHRTAIQQSEMLLPWVKSWAGGDDERKCEIVTLECEDWYNPIITNNVYLWVPPPAVADVACELMAQAIHKNPYATHIFLCPRLMTARWMRLVLKATDATWRIPAGSHIWHTTNHEPLVLSIYFSLSREKPWRHNRCNQFGHESKIVQTVLSRCTTESGIALRKLLTRTRHLAGL